MAAGSAGSKLREKMRPTRYSEEQLAAFEAAMGIALPPAYRRYMQEVGGGEGTHSKVSLLEEWNQPYTFEDFPSDFLAQAFPHENAWNDQALWRKEDGWKSAYFDRLLFRGAMRIANRGCEAYDLLVVSGVERGNIWRDERVDGRGIYPLGGPHGRVPIEKYLRGPWWLPWGRPW
jgi:hypothetical protein